jgi:ribose transport system substrate-binding protein
VGGARIKTAQLYGDLLGVEVTVFDANFTAEKQRQQLEQIAGRTSTSSRSTPGPSMPSSTRSKAILAKNIPVIQMDTKIAEDSEALGVTTFIEPDNIYMGETMATMLFNSDGRQRRGHPHAGPAHPHRGPAARHRLQERGRALPRHQGRRRELGQLERRRDDQALGEPPREVPRRQGRLLHNDDMALAAAQVAKAKSKSLKLVGIDGMEPACEAVARGDLLGTVINPTGRIHGGAMWVGYLLATKKIDSVPKYIRADGGVVERTTAEGFTWLGEQALV